MMLHNTQSLDVVQGNLSTREHFCFLVLRILWTKSVTLSDKHHGQDPGRNGIISDVRDERKGREHVGGTRSSLYRTRETQFKYSSNRNI
jgi:hypothetical protein